MRCVVSTCNHDSNSTSSQGITFHMFPAEESLRVAWVTAINKEGWNPTQNSSVCSNHFLLNDLYLTGGGVCKVRDGAVPIVHKQDEPKSDELISCDVKVCRICFTMDCNLYSMKLFKNLNQAYGTVTGLWIKNENNMPPYLCSECSHQLMKCSNFKNKILQAHSTLEMILKEHDCITLESIKCANGNQHQDKLNTSTTNNQIYHYNVEIERVKNENLDTGEQTRPTDLHSPHEHFIVEGIKKENDDMVNPDSPKGEDITNDIVYSPIFHKYMVPEGSVAEKDDACKPDRDRHNYQDTINYNMMHSNALVDENYPADVVRTVQEAEEMAMRIADTVENLTNMSRDLNQTKFNNYPKPLPETDARTLNDKLSYSDETSEKPFTCSICKKSFSQKSWLMNHLRIHSGERPYSCDVCKKTFNDKSNYRKHLRIHSGEKPYPCTFCDKTFNRKNYLENHLRTHSGEKPYSCGICNKVFGHKHHLKSHLRIHSGEKPYSCHICKKEFSEKSNLHMHLKVHSGDRLYSCDECKIAFSTKYLLKCHSMQVHSEKSNELAKLLNKI